MASADTALITGIAGQDGRLLAERLCRDGYRVVGVLRPGQESLAKGVPAGVAALSADLTSSDAVAALLEEWQPTEVYHLAAYHHSAQDSSAFSALPMKHAMLVNNFHTTHTIAFALLQLRSKAHFVFAASSQMYMPQGHDREIDESTPRNPATLYGLTKSWSMELLAFLRAKSDLRASTAILFNHESPLRGPQFVSRKITRAAAKARTCGRAELDLLNIGTRVDWCSARDVVAAMHMMARSDKTGDYVVASGEPHSVRQILEIAFGHVGLEWRDFTRYESDVAGPALIGRPDLLRETLGWRPDVAFADMIVEMVERDLEEYAGG
jgi:GDPmannose 4,6-dehydratase